MRFGVFPNITHAPGLVALADNGPLKQLLPNADIQVTPFNSGTPAVEAMFSDALDITYIGPNPAINAFAKSNGEAVRVISGSTSGGAFLVVKPEITSAADLKGKKIASPSLGNTQDVALRSWLKEQGLTDRHRRRRRRLGRAPGERPDPRDLPGRHDRRRLGPRAVGDPADPGGGAKVLVDERDLWPDGKYVTTHLMVAKKFLDANPEVVKRILLANHRGRRRGQRRTRPTAQAIVNAEIEKFTTKKLGDGPARRPPGRTSPSPSTRSRPRSRSRPTDAAGAGPAQGPGRPVEAVRPDAAQRDPPGARTSSRSRGCDGIDGARGDPAAADGHSSSSRAGDGPGG